MRAQVVNTVILVAFGIMLFVSIALVVGEGPKDMDKYQFVVSWLTNMIGLFVATVAALGLLLRSIEGADLAQIAVLTLPLLAGLLLIQVHWSLVLALGALALAIVVKETVALFARAGTAAGSASSNH